jgi:hypothetical protein
MRDETKKPALGRVPTNLEHEHTKLLMSMKETIEVIAGRRGSDYLDKAVTYRDLVNLGLITESQVPRKG